MKVFSLTREIAAAFARHDSNNLAAAIAYYTLLSIFPLLLGLLALAGAVITDAATRARLVDVIASLFPAGSGELIRGTIHDVVAGRKTAGVIATVALIWSGSGFLGAITQALDRIWEVPRQRHIVLTFVLAVAMELGIGLLFVVSLLVSTVVQLALNFRIPYLGGSLATLPLLVPILGVILPLVVTFGVFLLIYFVGPNLRLSFDCVWPGAAAASVLFEISKQAFAVYLASFAGLNAVYGPIGAVIALVTWAYYAAIVLLAGAEFNAVLARHRGLCAPGQRGRELDRAA